MAKDDLVVFDEFFRELGEKVHQMATDTFKMAIITALPDKGQATPRLGDFTEVGTGGTYVAGGTALVVTWLEAAGVTTYLTTTSPTWAANAGNDAATARAVLVYNDTSAGKEAVLFVDLGAVINMVTQTILITAAAKMFSVATP